jgi:hypothetical protein
MSRRPNFVEPASRRLSPFEFAFELAGALLAAPAFEVAFEFVNRAAARFSLRTGCAGSKGGGRLLFRRASLTLT